MLCLTFQSLSPVLRYSKLYFTVHFLKVWMWSGGFHSTSREPRSPGSVIWRSRGGATTLKTEQRVKQNVQVKKTNPKQSWKLSVWYFDMNCWNAAAGCGGKCCSPDCLTNMHKLCPCPAPKNQFLLVVKENTQGSLKKHTECHIFTPFSKMF